MPANKIYFQRDGNVSLRREHFGGMAFHRANGTTVEFDREGEYLLEMLCVSKTVANLKSELSHEFNKRFTDEELYGFLDELRVMGFVKTTDAVEKCTPNNINHDAWHIHCNNHLAVPETVHLSITNRCNLNCPCCYVKGGTNDEMTTKDIFRLIDKLAKMRVFQLAIGGGEPLLRNDIFKILDYCNRKNIVPNITSNGTLVDEDIIKKIKRDVGQINISLNGYSSKTNCGRDVTSFGPAMRGLKMLLSCGVPAGVNVLVTRESLLYLHNTLKFLSGIGVKRVNVLRPKPSRGISKFANYELCRNDLDELQNILNAWQGVLYVTVDSSLTCLMRDIHATELHKNAVYGCTGGTRFCTIDSNGDVYPCSFLKAKEHFAGNVLLDDFRDIWANADIFNRLRKKRQKLKGKCNTCRIKNYCGGCRSVALDQSGDFYGEDRGCSGG
jgi:radical SAM protein with 4Fe4S-binding SPASM domain